MQLDLTKPFTIDLTAMTVTGTAAPVVTPPAALPLPLALGSPVTLNGWVPASPFANGDISTLPLDTTALGTEWSATYGYLNIHLDNSMPINVTDSTLTPPVKVAVNAFAAESDLVMVPMGGAVVEGSYSDLTADRHILQIDRATGWAYELYHAAVDAQGNYSCDSLTIWDLTKPMQRPFGFTSADAAGLSIVAGVINYSEAAAGVINHAARMTFGQTRQDAAGNVCVLPATHGSGNVYGLNSPCMGTLVRLKASVSLSGFSPVIAAVLRTLQTQGARIADNGSYAYITVDTDPRWATEDLVGLNAAISLADFEVVDTGPALDAKTPPVGAAPVIVSFTAVQSGANTVLTWSITDPSGQGYAYFEWGQPVRETTLTVPYITGEVYTLVASNLYGRTTATATVS